MNNDGVPTAFPVGSSPVSVPNRNRKRLPRVRSVGAVTVKWSLVEPGCKVIEELLTVAQGTGRNGKELGKSH